MALYRTECPNCGSVDTKRVYVEWSTDLVQETRICEDCPAQFTNSYDLYAKSEDEVAA